MNLRSFFLSVLALALLTCVSSAWYLFGRYAERVTCPTTPSSSVLPAPVASNLTYLLPEAAVSVEPVSVASYLSELETRANASVACSDRSRETAIPGLTDVGYRKRFLNFRDGWVGCFADAEPSEMSRVSSETNQPHLCAEQCRDAGYLFATIKRPDGCYCSNVVGGYGRLADNLCPVMLVFHYGATLPEWYEPVGKPDRSAVFMVRNATLGSVEGSLIRERPPGVWWGWRDYPLPERNLPPLPEVTLRQHVRYSSVLDCGCRLTTDPAERLINVFLPVRGRGRQLTAVLRYMWEATLRMRQLFRVSFVVVEVDATPQLEGLCKQSPAKPEYIFIPQEAAKLTGCGDQFAKALAYNVGFLVARKARWNVFHDVDVIVNIDFFQKLYENYLQKDPNLLWIQPYAEYTPQRLYNETTKVILDVAQRFELPLYDLSNLPIEHMVADWGIAPGGSIVVRGDVFERVGGYDPELFFGYAPEDSMLWYKLAMFAPPRHAIDPPIYVYHLWHDQTIPRYHIDRSYSQLDYMNALVIEFRNGTQAFKEDYVALKQRLFRL